MNVHFKELGQSFQRLRRLLLGVTVVVLFLGIAYFIYINWYLVVIHPEPLDPGVTQRRQTPILTKEYEEIEAVERAWSELPGLEAIPNVFDSGRSS